MKKLLIPVCVLLLCLLSATAAFADRTYILPESDTRALTWAEIDAWDYQSLGFAYWEIYARHGLSFDSDPTLKDFFLARPWYYPDPYLTDRSQIQLSAREQHNLQQIANCRNRKVIYDSGRNIFDSTNGIFPILNGFREVTIGGNKVMPVYSAPSTYAWRGANGKAECSSNGYIFTKGYENDWMLIMYETNAGAYRVGYVQPKKVVNRPPVAEQLEFEYSKVKVLKRCVLTDDPNLFSTSIATLNAGTQVTYLCRFQCSKNSLDYIEVKVNGKTARGFVRAGCLDVPEDEDVIIIIE